MCKRVWLLVEKVFALTDIGFQLCKQLHIHFWLKTKNHQFSIFTFDFKEHPLSDWISIQISVLNFFYERKLTFVHTRKSAAFGRTFPSACWAQIRLSSLWWKSCLRTNEHRVSNGLLNVWIHDIYIIHISNVYPLIKSFLSHGKIAFFRVLHECCNCFILIVRDVYIITRCYYGWVEGIHNCFSCSVLKNIFHFVVGWVWQNIFEFLGMLMIVWLHCT